MGDLATMKSTFALLSSLMLSTVSAQQWELVTPVKTRSELPAVRMTGPTTGYMIDRVMGFVLKTTDAGDSWKRFPFNMLDKPKALWMWDEQRGIIAANSGRFYRTSNGWDAVTSVFQPTWGNGSCIYFVNDTLGWAGMESGKILRTTDAGATWTLQTSGTTNAIMDLHFVDELHGFACATGLVALRTDDGGATWTLLSLPTGTSLRRIHFTDSMNGIGVGIGGVIARTSDAGDSWEPVTSPTANSLLGLHVRGNRMIAMGTWGTVITSTDGGSNWSQLALDVLDLYSASFDESGIGLLTGKARVYRSLDFGDTWEPVQIGTYHTYLSKASFGNESMGASAGWLTSGGLENGVIRTEDGGRHWTNTAAGSAQWLGVHLRPDGVGWLGGGSGANRHTTDFFATSTNHTGPSVAIRSTWAFSTSTAIVAGGYVNGGCYRTTNGGSSWAYSATGNIYDIWFVDGQLGFCGGEGGALQKSVDGGASWQPLTSPTTGDIYSIFFLNDTLGFLGCQGSSWKTVNGGDSWTIMGSLPQYTMYIEFTDPDTGYAVSVGGYGMMTTDGGENWDLIVPQPFDALIGDGALVDGALFAFGRYGDVYRAELQCPVTANVPNVLSVGDMLCTGERPGVQWYLDGSPLPDGTTPCITTDVPGSYTVVTTSALGCISAPSAPVLVIGTSLPSKSDKAPAISPNPTNGLLNVNFTESRTRTLLVCDSQGKVVQRLRTNSQQATIDLSGMPQGIYLLRETAVDWSARIIKE